MDDEAISTQVAVNAEATKTAGRIQAQTAAAQAEFGHTMQNLFSVVVIGLAVAGGVVLTVQVGRIVVRKSAPAPAPSVAVTVQPPQSVASQSVVDAQTGQVSRLPAIVFHDQDGYKQYEDYTRLFNGTSAEP